MNRTYINNVINIIINSPFDEVVKHELGFVLIEFSCSQKSKKVVIIILRVINNVIIFNVSSEFFKASLLILVHVSHESIINL